MTTIGDATHASPCLALDIGASKVDAAVVSGEGTVSRRERVEVGTNQRRLFDDIVDMMRRVARGAGVGRVGVGCAGPMSRGGEIVSPLNIPAWSDFPLRESLRSAMGLEVYVDGDARALALAEGTFGAARDLTSYLSMVVSTGIGGGIVLNGSLLDGATGNAGHVGHLIVVPEGALCSCGARGCLEAEASGRSIAVRTGRPACEADQTIRARTGELVGKAVGTLSSVLDFSRCFVAGSVALGFGEEFFAPANRAAHEIAKLPFSKDVQIVPSGLGSRGPLLGAALVGWRGSA